MSFHPDEVRFLAANKEKISDAESRLIADHPLTKASAIKDSAFFRSEFGDYGRSVMELVSSRSATKGKLPSQWLMCHESAQQATPLVAAQRRAERLAAHFPQGLVHDVTCSIGTEGAAITRAGMSYHGSDVDQARLLMARYNESRGHYSRADALIPASKNESIIVADPARRAGGRRITSPLQLIPPLPSLVETWRGHELAIKCAPGLDFSEWEGLVSVASVNGGVKEACLYTAGLSNGETREALLITASTTECTSDNHRVDRITDLMPSDVGADSPGKYLIDPDGAVIRSGLVRHYARREGLWMLDERIAYLTGDAIPAGRSGFKFVELVPLKKLKTVLKKHDCGSLEILVRGVDIDPDVLRKKLGLKGKRPMAVFCTRIGSQGVALICEAREYADELPRTFVH
ncbi:SAM-dependent methyltransferase [Corynebacterium pseudotuberculosis]|uniref:THUMP-like domain-containing protein n=1 Tax=Corynebacterium pseudotuberculosis TaxID=1719 RepID=UPI002417A4B7|nr:SAM-dependent methyltransferase [Corynebacterium pseudotuberculosis]WFP68033.1 SAM-dependent methyltransferase [Corynebacterium pseudotuberculosis]